MSNMMTLIRKKRKYSEKYSSKNVLRKRKREYHQVMLLELRQLQLRLLMTLFNTSKLLKMPLLKLYSLNMRLQKLNLR
jgi:hypothetical protein